MILLYFHKLYNDQKNGNKIDIKLENIVEEILKILSVK